MTTETTAPAPAPRQNHYVTDEEADAALDYLFKSASSVGRALKERIESEYMLKHIAAIEYLRHEGPASTREALARASEKYKEAAIKAAEAAGKHQAMLASREAAQTRIDMWRTQQSSIRAAARL